MVECLQRVIAVFGLLLGIVTWRLWIPQRDFPQVPLFRWAVIFDPIIDWVLAAIAVSSLIGMMIYTTRSHWRTVSCLAFAFSISLLIVFDQHRCQPWAYQFVLLAVILALVPGESAIGYLRILTISIYAYSALGKFDYQFLHTVGQQLFGSLVGLMGVDAMNWPLGMRLACAGCLPTIELAIAIGLLFENTRRLASYTAAIMHGILILVLGPTGLNHEWGVLLWNAFFACQSVLLFSGGRATIASSDEAGAVPRGKPNAEWLAKLLVGLAITLPIGERIGWFDHWPAWALYAPHSSRVKVEVARTAVDRLPESVLNLLIDPDNGDLWVDVPIARWSLATLAVPIYPQSRFQMGVAISLCEYVGEFEIRAIEQSTSSRWTGDRVSRTHEGISAIRIAAKRFLLNAHPRELSP